MTLTARNGLAPISTLFGRFLDSDVFTPVTRTSVPTAVWQDENTVFVEFDLPGVSLDDISVTLHNRELTVSGERKWEARDGALDNRTYGAFEQRLRIAGIGHDAEVTARLVNGVLHVSIPKSEAAKPRKIDVKAS